MSHVIYRLYINIFIHLDTNYSNVEAINLSNYDA